VLVKAPKIRADGRDVEDGYDIRSIFSCLLVVLLRTVGAGLPIAVTTVLRAGEQRWPSSTYNGPSTLLGNATSLVQLLRSLYPLIV
jgi:hypothetical protein